MYASHCPRSQETLEQSFLPTLRTLMQAPVTSPLTQIDQDSVALLFTSLTRPGVNKFHSKVSPVLYFPRLRFDRVELTVFNPLHSRQATFTITWQSQFAMKSWTVVMIALILVFS